MILWNLKKLENLKKLKPHAPPPAFAARGMLGLSDLSTLFSPLRKLLITSHFMKGRLLGSSANRLDENKYKMNIRNRPNTYLHPLLRSRQHTVIPGRDPESRKHTFVNNLVAYTPGMNYIKENAYFIGKSINIHKIMSCFSVLTVPSIAAWRCLRMRGVRVVPTGTRQHTACRE